MPKSTLTRRAWLRQTAVVAGAAGLASTLGGRPAQAEADTRLRMFWWGAKERAERTERVNKLYAQKNPSVAIEGETLGWADYWPRMATQTAGRNAADLLQMDYRYIFEYARRDALLPFDPFVPKTLKLGEFSKDAVDSGKVDGKIYGVSLGLNSTAMMIDKALIEQLGIKQPAWNATWAEVAEMALEITKAAKKDGFFGMADAGRYEPALDVWLRQQKKALYTDDGKLGFKEDDIRAWFAFWDVQRKRGACAAPDVQALDRNEVDSSLLTLGKAAISFANSNQLVAYQALNKSKVALRMFPAGEKGSGPGQYLKPSMLLSVSSRTKTPEAALKVVDFYINDPDAAQILGLERGVPASSAIRSNLEPALGEMDKAMAAYVSFLSDKASPLPAPPPKGAGEIEQLLRRVNEQVAFGKLNVKDGARQFYTDANAILARG